MNEVHEWLNCSQCHFDQDNNNQKYYIGRKFSDKSLNFVSVGEYNQIKVILPNVFDFEVVTFTPIIKKSKDIWISALGAIHMYNSGGAIVGINLPSSITDNNIENIENNDDSEDEILHVNVLVLGSGIYSFISPFSGVHIISCQPIGMNMNINNNINNNENDDTNSVHAKVVSMSMVDVNNLNHLQGHGREGNHAFETQIEIIFRDDHKQSSNWDMRQGIMLKLVFSH